LINTTVAALLALPLMANAGAGMNEVKQPVQQPVRVEMQVEAGAGKVVVKLAVANGGVKPVYVPKAVYADHEILRREFAITDMATGAEVQYTGRMVKRGPYTKDDFVAVKPGEKRSNSIDITRSYDFQPAHTYQLSYEGAYLADPAKLDALSAAKVAPVTFTVK
jgi:hypothetical protein